MTIQKEVKRIKQSFRQMTDGQTAASMRNKGLNYKLNWGASLPMLREMAKDISFNLPPSTHYQLAIALWKEDIRECKILATMLMPADEVLPEVIDIWMEQMPSQEMAEQAAMNLFQYLPYAPAKAYEWMASDKELYQLCGFHVMTRLFMNGQASLAVKKAAVQSLIRFAKLGLMYERLAKTMQKRLNLDFL